MASSREERFLMRQRGAGARQLRDSGFEFDIPENTDTPLQPQSSGRAKRTPLQAQRTPKSTPRTYSKKTTPSKRSQKTTPTKKSGDSGSKATEVDSQGSVRKKRRLATPVEAIPEETTSEDTEQDEETGSGDKEEGLQENEEGAQDNEEEEGSQDSVLAPLEEVSETEAAAETPTAAKYNASPSTDSARKRKKRKSIGQQSMRKKRKSNLVQVTAAEDDEEEDEGEAEEERSQSAEEAVASPSKTAKSSTTAPNGALATATGNTGGLISSEHVDDAAYEAPVTAKKRGRPVGKRVSELKESETPAKSSVTGTPSSSGKGRGRPRKSDVSTPTIASPDIEQSATKKRGRPRKSMDATEHTPAKSKGIEKQKQAKSKQTEAPGEDSVEPTQDEEIDEVQGEASQPVKRRGRPKKSDAPASSEVVEASARPAKLPSKKRKADELRVADGDQSPVTERHSKKAKARDKQQRKSDAAGDTQDELEAQSDDEPAVTPTKHRGRPRKSDASTISRAGGASNTKRGRPRKSDVVADNNTTGPQAEAESGPMRQRSTSPDAGAQSKRKPKDGGIPVLVHRLSKARRLNFIEDDEDDLAGPAPLMKKTGVNAIDVLAQISREIVAKFIEQIKLKAQAEQGSKKQEWKRKKQVIEGFDNELQSRLLQMTTALDHNQGLATKLRQVNKSKATYRNELLELKRQREELAIQMDAIRIKHDRSTESAKGTNDLNTALHDIELAVQRGRAAQQQASEVQGGEEDASELSLEAKIRQVVEDVSSAGGRQGLLDKVKQYNSYLEAAVGAW